MNFNILENKNVINIEKFFWFGFGILGMYCFVVFPLDYYFDSFGNFTLIFFLTYIFFTLLAISANHFLNLHKKILLVLIPVFIFISALFVRLLGVIAIGQNTIQISDFGNAVYQAQQAIPIYSKFYSLYSGWALYPLCLKIIMRLLNGGIYTILIFNAVLGALSAVIVYFIVYCFDMHRPNTAIIAGILYGLWPTEIFYIILCTPEYLHIFTILMGFLLLEIALFIPMHSISRKLSLIIFSGIFISFSGFMKATSSIMLIAIAITVIIYILEVCLYQVKASVCINKPLIIIKGISKLGPYVKKCVVYLFIFLIVFFICNSIFYALSDWYVGYEVNRKPIIRYLYGGLHHISKGVWVSEIHNRYEQIWIVNDYDFEMANKLLLEELCNDIQANHLTLAMFYNKAKYAFSDLSYMSFVLSTVNSDNIILAKQLIEQAMPFMQIYYMLVGLFVVIAALDLTKKRRKGFLFSALYITGFICLMLLSENQPRYKTVIYPFLCILAAHGVTVIYNKVKKIKEDA